MRLGVWLLQIGVFVALAVAIGAFYGGWQGFAEGFDPACTEPVCDWGRHYVPTAATVFESPQPQWGYLYPPTLALLIAPWAAMPGSEWVWAGLLLASMMALAVLPPHLVPKTSERTAVLTTALTVLSVPILQTLSWGQVSSLLVLMGVLALVRFRKNPWLSGALLGVAIAVKLYPALWLVWLVVRRRWAALGVSVVIAGLLLGAMPVALLGLDATVAFYGSVSAELTRMIPDFRRSVGPQSVPSVAVRVLLGRDESLRLVMTVASALVGLGLLGALWWLPRRRPADAAMWACVLAYGTFPFFLESAWLHYFVHLPLGWMLVMRALDSGVRRRLGVWTLLICSVLLGTIPAWWAVGPAWYPAFGLILLSHLTLLGAMALVMFDGQSVAGGQSMGGADSPST